MKKLIITIAAIFISASFFSSCNKEQSIASDQPSGLKTYTLTISATKSPSTKALVLDSNTLNSVWGANDEVDVLYGEPKVKVGTLYPLSTGSETAVLSGTITASISPDDWIDLWYGGDLSNQDGSLASLNTNHYDRAKAWFQVDHIDGTTIVPQGSVVFNNWQAIVKFTVKNGDAALPVSKMLIKSSNGNLTGGSGQTLTITPSSDTSELFVALDNFDDDNNVNRLSDYEILVKTSNGWYSCNATNKTFQRGKYYDITLKVQSNTYTVAGTPAAAFSDKEWTATASENDLVYSSESGLYSKSFTVPGTATLVKFKVVKNYAWTYAWPSSDYEVGMSANGFTKTLTINFDPATNEVTHALVENTSPYKLYVKDEELATATKWGSARSTWGEYDFVQEADVDGFKCFAIPHAIVDGTAHDVYYKGENGCEVRLASFTPSTSTTDYRYKTNGFEIVPSTESYTGDNRVWVQTNRNDVYAHMWENANNSNTTIWGTCLMRTDYAKYDGKYWYYANINTGWDKLILSWGARGETVSQRVSYDISDSQNYYYYVTYNNDSDYYYGPLFSGGWEE